VRARAERPLLPFTLPTPTPRFSDKHELLSATRGCPVTNLFPPPRGAAWAPREGLGPTYWQEIGKILARYWQDVGYSCNRAGGWAQISPCPRPAASWICTPQSSRTIHSTALSVGCSRWFRNKRNSQNFDPILGRSSLDSRTRNLTYSLP